MKQPKGNERRIAVLYEHPEWFQPLFAELDRRQASYDRWEAHRHMFDPRARSIPYALVVNRMSPSAYLRGHGGGIFYTLQLLAYLRDTGIPVLNGYEAFRVETSKVLQLEIFEKLGVRYPRTRVINDGALAAEASEGFELPVVVKPNVGGSGAKIRKFDSREALREAASTGGIDLGFDATALVQEFLPARGNAIVRVEVLDGEFLYAIKIATRPEESFNLCPADICGDDAPSAPGTSADGELGRCVAAQGPSKRRLHIESYAPPRQVIDEALRIAREAQLDVGGIEYLESERDGKVYFYDVNALSNFVTDAPRIVGFDPYARLVDSIVARAGGRAADTAGPLNAGSRRGTI